MTQSVSSRRTSTPWIPTADLILGLLACSLVAVLWWWVQVATWAAQLTARINKTAPLPTASFKQRAIVAFGTIGHPTRVLWPSTPPGVVSAVWWWPLTLAMFAAGCATVGAVVVKVVARRRGWRQTARISERFNSPLWATRTDVERIGWRAGSPCWYLGRAHGVEMGAKAFTSVSVMAATQSGKTAGLVVPNVQRFPGSLLVIGSKADVVVLTREHRATKGPVYIFDPTGLTGLGNVAWSMLGAAAGSFATAKKVAQVFVESVGAEDNAANAKFWQEHGSKVMAAVLRAATLSGAGVQDISRWLHSQDVATVAEILESTGEIDALVEWRGAAKLPPETRGGVFATAQTLFSAFADPEIIESVDAVPGDVDVLDLRELIHSEQVFTLYVICPDDAARRVKPVFEALLGLLLQEGFNRHLRTQAPLRPPLGVILEEAGNIAAPANLDVIVSSYAAAGMPVLTVWQDAGQIEKHYGPVKARTVAANHTTQMLLRGNLDERELQRWSTLIGKHVWEQVRHQSGSRGSGMSLSIEGADVEVATADWLRQLPQDVAVVLSSATKPILATLTPWFRDPTSRVLIESDVAARFDREYGVTLGPPRTRREARRG